MANIATLICTVATLLLAAPVCADDEVDRLVQQLSDPHVEQRIAAINALADLGARAAPAARQVVQRLNATDLLETTAALNFFDRLGPLARDALPELIWLEIETRLARAYSDEAWRARRAVGGDHIDVEEWDQYPDRTASRREMWRSPSYPSRDQRETIVPTWIGQALPRHFADVENEHVRLLVRDLDDSNAAVRWAALRGLEFGLSDAEFLEVTVESAFDPDPRIRGRVMDRLWQAGEKGRYAAAIAFAMYHRMSDAQILEQTTRCPSGDEMASRILDACWVENATSDMGHLDRRLKFAICTSLEGAAVISPRQLRFLSHCVSGPDPDVRHAAERTIDRHALCEVVIDQGLRPQLMSDDPAQLRRGLRGMRHVGRRVDAFVPRLLDLLNEPERAEFRLHVVAALGAVTNPSEDVVVAIERQLTSDAAVPLRRECLATLAAYRDHAARSKPLLIDLLADHSVRHEALSALRSIYPADAPQQEKLRRLRVAFLVEDLRADLSFLVDRQRELQWATRQRQLRELFGPIVESDGNVYK